jgi:ParB family transcriptional regulator, chromosome partitioning protein
MTTLTLPPAKPRTETQGQGLNKPSLQRAGTRVQQAKEVSRFVPISSLLHSRLTPRWNFDERRLNALAASINERGVLEPLIVREVFEFGERKFEIVKGERRFRASLIAELEELPVIVRELTDAEARQVWMAKTVHRANANTVEQSEAIMELLQSSLGLDQQHVKAVLLKMHAEQRERGDLRFLLEGYAGHMLAEQVERVLELFTEIGTLGFQSYVTNRLPIFDLPEPLLNALRDNEITLKDALLLKGLGAFHSVEMLEQHQRNKWTHAQLRAAIRSPQGGVPNQVARAERIASVLAKQQAIGSDVDALLSQLETVLGLPALN